MSRSFSAIWFERFGVTPDFEFPDLADALDRRSARDFTGDPLDPALLEALVGVALSGSTTCGLQTWSVISVEDPALRHQISEWSARQEHVELAPTFLVFCADLSRAERLGGDPDALDLTEFFLMAVMDATVAAERLVRAAESRGLGASYLGSFRNRIAGVADALGLPSRVAPLFALCLGETASIGPLRPRLKPVDVLHVNRYVPQEDIEGYDERMQPYFEQLTRKDPATWSDRLRDRLIRHHAEGREDLLPWLQSQGLARR
jgi:nitroreductase